MRCTSCGTQNEPDSRFCGGCGAKLASAPAQSRLAPTAKIPDDAAYPPQAAAPTGPRPQVGGYGPASIPPGFNPHAPASIPPTSRPPPQESFARAVTPPMQTPARGVRAMSPRPDSQPGASQPPVRPAASMADSVVLPPQRPLGLMVVILLLDLGLAGAGAVMLAKGLSAKKAPSAPGATEQKPTPPVQKSEAAPAPVMQPASLPGSAPTAAAIADPPAPAAPAAAPAADPPAAAKRPATTSARKDREQKRPADTASSKGPVTHPATGPEDPYAASVEPARPVAFDLAAESAHLTSRSKAELARCQTREIHGALRVAYQVLADGSVQHAMAVENSTGDDALGDCVASTISKWRYSPHGGGILSSVRTFNYP